MSALRRRWLVLRHPHVEIVFHGPVRIGPGFSLHAPDGGRFEVGAGVEFRRDFRAELVGDAEIVIGEGTAFTYGCTIQCSTRIEIGAGCLFAQSSAVFDGSHRFRDPDLPILAQGYDLAPVEIGDHVGVMSNCTVLADVGEHSFLGANTVVTEALPPRVLAVGAPARVVEAIGAGES